MHVLIILRQSSALLDATCSWLIFNINGVTLECCVLLCMAGWCDEVKISVFIGKPAGLARHL